MKSCYIFFWAVLCLIFLSSCETEIGDEGYPYTFNIQVVNAQEQNLLDKDNPDNVLGEVIEVIYKGTSYALQQEKPEEWIGLEPFLASMYGAYLEVDDKLGTIVCFGEADLLKNKDDKATIELHIGERKFTLSAKFNKGKKSTVSCYLDGAPCIGDPFEIVL